MAWHRTYAHSADDFWASSLQQQSSSRGRKQEQNRIPKADNETNRTASTANSRAIQQATKAERARDKATKEKVTNT
jgi:hypothetical protein